MADDGARDIRVRPATQRDATAVAEIHVAAWQDTYAGILPADRLAQMNVAEQTRAWRYRLMKLDAAHGTTDRVFVAEDRGRNILGYGSCGLNRRFRMPYCGEVFTLYISPYEQGRGIGTRLVGAMFRHLMTSQINSAVIWALRDNPNRHFYSAIGGRLIAERDSDYWGSPLTEMAYAWPDLAKWRLEMRNAARNRTP